jgi:hypothetical protein
MEADTEEIQPDPRMLQPVAEHEEVSKEKAAVILVGGLRKRRRDRNLAVVHRQKPKGRIQASCESRKRLTITCRKMTRCATVALHKMNIVRKYCTRASVVQEIWRRLTFWRRRQPKPEYNKDIRSRDAEKLLHLRKGRKTANSIGGQSRNGSHDWKVWETVTRSSGKPLSWSSGSEQLDHVSHYKKSRTGHCGMVGHVQNG